MLFAHHLDIARGGDPSGLDLRKTGGAEQDPLGVYALPPK